MTVPSCDGSVTGWSLEDTFRPSARSWAVASASDEPPTDGTVTRGGRRATKIVTVEPRRTRASPPGSCASTVPGSLFSSSRSWTATSKRASSSVEVASRRLWPTTDGTVTTGGPLEMTSVTVAPPSSWLPAGGSVSIARFSSIVLLVRRSSSILKPASLNRSRASERRSPSTAGTWSMPCPSDTVISMVEPVSAPLPAPGRWETTRSRGWRDDRRRTARTSKPAARSRCVAAVTSRPTTSGTARCSPPPSSCVAARAAAAATTSASSATRSQRRRRLGGASACRTGIPPVPLREAGASPVTTDRTSSSAAMNASASAKRRSGSFSSAWSTTASSSGGTPATTRPGGTGGSETCLSAMLTAVSPSNGGRPTSSS